MSQLSIHLPAWYYYQELRVFTSHVFLIDKTCDDGGSSGQVHSAFLGNHTAVQVLIEIHRQYDVFGP